MKKVMWKWDYSESTIMLDPSEIEERIAFGEEPHRIQFKFVDPEVIDLGGLTQKARVYCEEHDIRLSMDSEELESFFESIGLPVDVNGVPYNANADEYKDAIIYDGNSEEFSLGSDWPFIKVYEYFDGSNLVVKTDEEAIETVVEVQEEEVNLDEWDGHNMVTGSTGHHQYIQKVVGIDGEKVDDTYLLVKWSQWQGSLPSGTIMSIDEVKSHLESIGRDVNEYMAEISKNLGK